MRLTLSLSLFLLFLSVVIELLIVVEDSKQKLASPERNEQCHFECWIDYNYCIPTYYNYSTSYIQPLHETYVRLVGAASTVFLVSYLHLSEIKLFRNCRQENGAGCTNSTDISSTDDYLLIGIRHITISYHPHHQCSRCFAHVQKSQV